MNVPNRSAEVAAWVSANRALFVGDADSKTRELLTPLARHLNGIEGRDVWGLLVKSERNPPFIPHDILMWKDTREHIDVFTGPDSGRAEDVQAVWGYNPPPSDARWIWQSVGEIPNPGPIEPTPPEPPQMEAILAKLEQLAATQIALGQQIDRLEQDAERRDEDLMQAFTDLTKALTLIGQRQDRVLAGNTKAFGGRLELRPQP